MTMITPSYLGETIEYSSLHACRSTLEDPTKRMSDRLAHELALFNAYKARLIAEDPSIDEVTLADTLEGCTNLDEMLGATIRGVLYDETLAEALKARITQMTDRYNRLKDRAKSRRQKARDVMLEAGLKKLAMPECSVIVRRGHVHLVVTDERAIHKSFFEMRPALRRNDLLEALKAGEHIAGAELSNPEPVLSIMK